MIDEIGIFLIPPGMIMGILGILFASKIPRFNKKQELVASKTM